MHAFIEWANLNLTPYFDWMQIVLIAGLPAFGLSFLLE